MKKPVENGVAKVPVVMQMEALECGAASLTMILAYYGKWIPLEQVRADCGVSRDGSNAKNVLRAARSYGLTAQGYRYEPEDLKQNGTFPCIIHWNFNHFVVLNGFKKNKVYLNDPAKGNYAVSMAEFDEAFTGICLMFEPSENFVPDGSKKSMLSFAGKRLKGAGSAVAFVVLTTLITSLLGIINTAFSRIFMDRLLTGKNPEWVTPFLFALGGIGILQRKMMNAVVAQELVNTLSPLLLNTVMMVFYFIVMIRYSVILALVSLGSIVINLLVSDIISKKRVNITRVQMRDAGKLAGATASGIEMIETIKASGAENGYFEKWAGYQAGMNAHVR